MNKHTSLLSWCISVALAISPVVYAAGEGNLQVAKAIGEDTSTPAAATQPGTDTAKNLELSPVAQALSPTAKIGLAVAGLLALAGGGGGGAPPHP